MDSQSGHHSANPVVDTRRRQLLTLISLAAGVSAVSPEALAVDVGRLVNAGVGLAGSFLLTDQQLQGYFDQMAAQSDAKNKVAPPNSPVHQRMLRITRGLDSYDGLNFNYKVYETPEVNAFAMANGTIRFYSGLMDMMSDDEVRYVLGHEIGHVKSGHTKQRIQAAMRVGALRDAISATGPGVAALADSQLGDLFATVVTSKFSRTHENQADDYAMKFLKSNKYPPRAAVSALQKLAKLSGGGGGGWLSTHPAPSERAQRMQSQLA